MVVEYHTYTITYDDEYYYWYKETLLSNGYKLQSYDTQTETYAREMIYRPLRVEGDEHETD